MELFAKDVLNFISSQWSCIYELHIQKYAFLMTQLYSNHHSVFEYFFRDNCWKCIQDAYDDIKWPKRLVFVCLSFFCLLYLSVCNLCIWTVSTLSLSVCGSSLEEFFRPSYIDMFETAQLDHHHHHAHDKQHEYIKPGKIVTFSFELLARWNHRCHTSPLPICK